MAANPELREQLEQAIGSNDVLLLMKGTPEAPRCGFSMKAVGMLDQMGVEYGAIDVLPVLQPLREVTAEIAEWETFPQLYVKGELLGGCDLMEEMFEGGELAEAIGVDQPVASDEDPAPIQGQAPQPAQEEGPYQSPPMKLD